nr:hypothetical protein [Tanacetum cinerariifolium]
MKPINFTPSPTPPLHRRSPPPTSMIVTPSTQKPTTTKPLYHRMPPLLQSDDPTQGILDAGGIFLYNTPNKAFKILEDKVLLKLDSLDDFQNSPKPKTMVFAGESNINSDLAILMDKFEALATKINYEFLKIRKELKEKRDGHRDNHASQIYMRDDTLTYEPLEANYVQGYHEEMMREWMATHMEANEHIKDQVVELERQNDQGLRDRQAIIENLESQFEILDKKIHQTKSLPRTVNTKPRQEFVYKLPSIRNENEKGDVKFIGENEIKPIPTMPDPNPIMLNSSIVPPFYEDCTMHIPYTNAKTFADVVLPNHVGDKELKYIDGVGNGVLTKNEIKKDEMGMPKEPNKEWKLNEKVVLHNENVYHYLWHPTEIPHLNRIIKES